MLDTHDFEQMRQLAGHEVHASDGEKLGYVDLVFRDDETDQPEWLGIWDGLPDTKPRVLVPVRDVQVEQDVVRLPWPADVVRGAPGYEPAHNLALGRDHVVEVDAERVPPAPAPDAPEPSTYVTSPSATICWNAARVGTSSLPSNPPMGSTEPPSEDRMSCAADCAPNVATRYFASP